MKVIIEVELNEVSQEEFDMKDAGTLGEYVESAVCYGLGIHGMEPKNTVNVKVVDNEE